MPVFSFYSVVESNDIVDYGTLVDPAGTSHLCLATSSLLIQHAFENLEDSAKDGIVEELLVQGPNIFSEVAKNQRGVYCVLLSHRVSAQSRYLQLLNRTISFWLVYIAMTPCDSL